MFLQHVKAILLIFYRSLVSKTIREKWHQGSCGLLPGKRKTCEDITYQNEETYGIQSETSLQLPNITYNQNLHYLFVKLRQI